MPSSSSFPNNTGISADKFLPALQHAISGSAGTLISTCALYPLSLVITRLQVQRQLRRREGSLRSASPGNEAKGTTTTGRSGHEGAAEAGRDPTPPDGILAAFSQTWRSGGGPRAFYTGLAQDATKSVLDSFLFFLFYEWFRGLRLAARRRRHGGYDRTRGLAALEELAVGMAAGACSRLFTTPIANVVTRKQTASLVGGGGDGDGEPSAREILGDIRRAKGLAGLWSGYSASLVLALNPGITFFLQELLKKQAVAADRWDHPAAHVTFLLAAVSKAVASAITYPFQTAKTRLQAGVPVAPPESPKGTRGASPKADAPKDEPLIDLASVEAQASEGAEVPKEEAGAVKEGEEKAEASAEGQAPAEVAAAGTAAREPEAPRPRPVMQENVAPPERGVEREVDAKLDALKAVKDLGRQSIFGTVAQIARAEGVGSLYDGVQGELLKAFLGHGTTMLAKDVVHRLLFRLYLFVGSVLAELRARRAKRTAAATARRETRENVPKPSVALRSELEPEPAKALVPAGPREAAALRPAPRGAPPSVRLIPEPPAPYPQAPTASPSPSPRIPTYLPPPPPALPPPPPPQPPQQLRSLRYRIDDVDRQYPPPYPPYPYPYRAPPPPATARPRMSRNDIERATPSTLGDLAVHVVANMIDGTQRGFRDE
ncbi:mitochondrial carrier domain-containing protein [Hypoxylon cercidicola]|nr:mitochondrial carrier domain-containing protein [Hypoxylon cercidicola]